MTKFALISHILPPSPSGQAVILYRIFSGLNTNAYYLINTREGWQPDENANNGSFCLKGNYYALPREFSFVHPDGFGLSWLRKILNNFIKIFFRSKNILSVLRNEPDTNALIVCTGDFVDIPAVFLVSKIRRLPYYAYIFDDYVYQFLGMQRWVAKLIARYVFSRSAGVIGPNEFICQEYQQRYGVPVALVRNPCDKTELKKTPSVHSLGKNNRIKIIYTGSIYLANYDCFRNLVEVMKLLPEYSIELHIFTSQTAEQLSGEGIRGDRVFIHSHVPYGEVLEEQRNGDILFLPLTFGDSISEIVRTSAPGKLGEYLASGRPVLAHVPPDSFVAYYFQQYHCGLVASENNLIDLKAKLQKLLTDTDLYSTIVENARQRALVDFDPQLAQKNLVDFLNGN